MVWVTTPRDLTKPRIAPYPNTWNRLQNTVFWCNLKFVQEKGLQFYQTRSHAVVLHNTLPAACIEKAVCKKTQDELFQKVRLIPRVPRVVLKSNSQHGQQDPESQDARSSWKASKRFEKLRGNLQQQRGLHNVWSTCFCSTICENKVNTLIEKIENHKHKEFYKFSKNRRI